MSLKHTLKPFIYLFICVYGISNAQSSYKHYTSLDGLSHDITYNIIQDSKGYIWIGTDDGLSRFDGSQFKTYGLKDGLTSNYVMDIVELSDYSFAISTWGRGIHFLKNDTIKKSTKFADQNSKLYSIATDGESVFGVSGSSYLFYNIRDSIFEKKGFSSDEKFSEHDEIVLDFKLIETSVIDGVRYLHDQGNFKNDFFGVKILNRDYSIAETFPFLKQYRISAIHKIDNSNYVFAYDNQLIFSTDTAIKNIISIPIIPNDFRIIKILKVPENEDEYVLIAQDKDGFKKIYSYNLVSGLCTDFIKELSISTTISDATFDFEGNLWITTYGDGVYSHYYSNPKILSKLEGQYVTDLKKFKGNNYALTSSKLYEFNGDSLLSSYLINGFAKKIAIVNDTLVITALRTNSKRQETKKFTLIEGRFYSDSKFGIVRQVDTIFVNNKPIYTDNEIIITEINDLGSELIFYTNKGIWKYNPEGHKFYNDSGFELINETDCINGYAKKDSLEFFLTDRGLVIKSNEKEECYNEAKGLQNERINDFYKDDFIYLATQSGLSVINDNEVLNFSKSFGLTSLSINSILSDGNNLWLSGENGISIINKNDIKKTFAPKMDIKQNGLSFEVNTITHSNVATVTNYKINDANWLPIGSINNILDFSSYAYGNYQLQFRSRKENSDWAVSNVYTFKINPPWYKVWWVILAFVLISISIVVFLFSQRLKAESRRRKALQYEITKRITAEKELSEVRDNIAQDFHDDLGNKLASISLLSDLLSNKIKSEEKEIIKTIKTDADYLYKGTKDFIFSLQEKSNYADELRVYLCDFAEDYLHQFNVGFEVQVLSVENIKLPHYWSKQIIYIFKEAITNTVKHSEATLVRMAFELSENLLKIELIDNGKGFDTNIVNSNGLDNMVRRAKRISCHLEIISKANNGTSVNFFGKLP